MNAGARAAPGHHDPVRHACHIATACVLIIGFVFLLSTKVAFNDDLVWLYSGSFLVDKPNTLPHIKLLVADGLKSIDANSFLWYRFSLRDGFEDNYRINTYAYYLARLLTAPLPPDSDLAHDPAVQRLLINRIALGATISFASALALFSIALFWVRDRVLLISVAAVVLGITLVNFLPINSAPVALNNVVYWSNLTLEPGQSFIGTVVTTTWKFLVHPGPWFVPYHLAPKNQFQLILVAIFALRWGGLQTPAYALLAIACLFHHSYAAFFALFLATADAWWRPTQFLRPAALALAAVPAFANLSRSVGHQDWNLSIFAPAVLFLGIVAVAVVRRAGFFGTAERPVLLPNASPVSQDLVVFWIIWLVTSVVFALIALEAPPFEARYFWSNLHSRLYGLMLLPTYIGLAYLMINYLLRHRELAPRWIETRGPIVIMGALAGGCLLAAAMLLCYAPLSVFNIEPRNVPRSSHCDFETKSGAFEASYLAQMSADLELDSTQRITAFFRACAASTGKG